MLASPVAFTLYINSQEKQKHNVFDKKPAEEKDEVNTSTSYRRLAASSSPDGNSKNEFPKRANSTVINDPDLELDDKDGSLLGCLEFFYSSLFINCSNASALLSMDNTKSHHPTLSTDAERTLAETSLQHLGKADAQDSRDQAERSLEERKMLRSIRKVLVPRTLKRTRIQKLAFGRTKDFNIDATMSTTSLKRAPSSKVQGTKINQSANEVTNKKDLEKIVILKCKRVQQLTSGIVKDFQADPTFSTTLLEQAHSTVRSTMLHHSTTAPSHADDLGQLEILKSTRIKKLPSGTTKDFRADATISTTSLKQAPSKVLSTKLKPSASVLSKGRDFEQIEIKKENLDDCNDTSHGIASSTSSRPTSSSSNDFTNNSGLPHSLKLICKEKKLQTLHRGRWKDAAQF